MTHIVAVLVVPAAEDPGGLLAAGLCGGRPPWCWLGGRDQPECGLWYPAQPAPAWWHADDGVWDPDMHPGALPLWWDGTLVPEGWDRARRVHATGPHPVRHVGLVAGRWSPNISEAFAVAADLVRQGLASRVVRLTLEEVG